MSNTSFWILNKVKLTFIIVMLSGALGHISAQISLPSIFNDNMVLQRNFEAPIWGWAEPGTEVKVSGNWSRMPARSAISDRDGKWMVKLTTFDAGGPYQVYINDRIIDNVMIGEVWICSGQSNMQFSLDETNDSATDNEIRNADHPNIRLFYVARENAREPNTDCYGKWEICKPETARTFSSVAYYFAKELQNELNVPVGLIHTSWGGSPAQAWIDYKVLKTTPEGKLYIEKYNKMIEELDPGINPRDHRSPSSLYNGMLNPLIPFGIRGAIWYQGESNVGNHDSYTELMNTMITSWRDEWDQEKFPFYYVQIAPYDYQSKIVGAALRDAQRKTLDLPGTGMVVTLDIGNPDDIHPVNKKDVGNRLALWALGKTYGINEIVYSGPLYKSMKKENDKIRLFFDFIGRGLLCKDEKLTNFQIAGEDKIFYSADASIDKNTILVSSDRIRDPYAVRYAFQNSDEASLFNEEDLPASTFRTDDWKIITDRASITGEFELNTGDFIVSIKSDKGNDVRYTLDGSEPTISSTRYDAPFSLSENAMITARVFIDGEASLLTSEIRIEKHLANGKQIMYKDKYHRRFTGGGNYGLINGIFGSRVYKDGKWQGFWGKNMEVIIDLEEEKNISSLGINCLQMNNVWIIFPKEIEVYSSDDAQDFMLIESLVNNLPVDTKKAIIHNFELDFKSVKTRYVKVIAKNFGELPEWHNGAGNDSWLFVDEIIVK